MTIHTYRYGEAATLPGLSIGVTRHPPRGVKREDYATRGYFHVWVPLLGPSPALLAAYQKGSLSFPQFACRYRAEMKRPEPRQTLQLLAAVAQHQRINLGCYCRDAAHCHRTLLAELLTAETKPSAASALMADQNVYASPACSMPEIED